MYCLINKKFSKSQKNLMYIEMNEDMFMGLMGSSIDPLSALENELLVIRGDLEMLELFQKLGSKSVENMYKPLVYSDRTDHPLDKGFDLPQDVVIQPLTASCIVKLEDVLQ